MMTLVTGKPGDGKTLYDVALLADVIEKSEYYVVTNMSLLLGPLHEELRRRKWDGNLDGRLRVIDHAESFEFYRFRAGGLVLDHSPDWEADEKDGAKRMPKREFDRWFVQQFQKLKGAERWRRPVVYFIDEAHEFFPSREWMKVGRGVSFYATKHRHLHDEVFLITQVPEQLDSALRRLVSETHVLRNNLRRSVGPFRLRPVFRVRKFYGMPSDLREPYATTTFHLRPDQIARCYRTASAFGDVVSGGEKIVPKARLPWWSLWVGAGALAVVLTLLIFAIPRFIVKKSVEFVTDTGAGVVPKDLRSTTRGNSDSAKKAVVEIQTGPKRLTGVLVWNGEAVASFSDGSTADRSTGLEEVRQGGVRVAGVDYTW